ncbi:MAG: TRAP transporter small permease [Spirochaetales bacterium]|nr:TRAP transporter small permease [Spirochaetales bacterium]
MNLYKQLIGKLYRGLVYFQTFLTGILLLIVTLQILTRLLPFLPRILWTEEAARFLLVWVIFLGAALGVKEGTHFTVSLLPEAKSPALAKLWDFGVGVLMTLLSLIFAYRGFKYVKVLFWDVSDMAQISMAWVGAALPVFALLSLIFLSETFINLFIKEGS